jgi:streptogramin lyase
MRFRLAAALCLPALLTGCGYNLSSSSSSNAGLPLTGRVHGGRTPIVGAHVYVLSANDLNFGQQSLSLLLPTAPGVSTDSVGSYVTTDANGGFSITGDYTCTSGEQVYIYAKGGDAGAGPNSAIGLMTALGPCPTSGNFLGAYPFIYVNEVTTAATAYALAPFAYDSTHISTSTYAYAQTGIANAFKNAANLADPSTGKPPTPPRYGNSTDIAAELATFGNILAACVNSAGPSSTGCTSLYSYTPYYGDPTYGHAPGDTASAAINMAHNPTYNVAGLYGLSTAVAPFQPALTSQPRDFTVSLIYTGNGLSNPFALDVDSKGDIWSTNTSCSCLVELASNGARISPIGGYTGGGLNVPEFIKMDPFDNAWVNNSGSNGISKISSLGVPLSPSTGFGSTVLNAPVGIAIDISGNVWVINYNNSTATELDNDGNPIDTISLNGLALPVAIVIDVDSDLWIGNYAFPSLSEFDHLGHPIANYPLPAANDISSVDASPDGTVWVLNLGTENSSNNGVNRNSGALFHLSSTGSVLSPAGGFTGQAIGFGNGIDVPYAEVLDGRGNPFIVSAGDNHLIDTNLNSYGTPNAIPAFYTTGFNGTAFNLPEGTPVVDLSGCVWVPNYIGNSVTQVVGVAHPKVSEFFTFGISGAYGIW